jgi:penicillin-binding protein 1C
MVLKLRENKKRVIAASSLVIALLLVFLFSLRGRLFQDPYSTVLKAKDGELLSATIARDGQWRFPEVASVPRKFSEALVTFEDKRFYRHYGVDVLALGRAFRDNVVDRRVVSGGSTITMQVIRLSRKGKPRSFFQKILEIGLATRLEFGYSKQEILSLYASHAPFGGNVVGLEAACWRYFGRAPDQLSWGEATLLAVLPNAPSLMHPGKNRDQLRAKRDHLLDKLVAAGKVDSFTADLAKEEEIPDKPLPLPRHARHLLTRAIKEGRSQNVIISTISNSLQTEAERIIQDHHLKLASNQIHNAAAIILDVATGKTLAYIGNIEGSKFDQHHEVDAVIAPRSTGSILKPFLFAAMLDEGKILPGTLLPDVPTIISGFAPKNFSMGYDGAVAANKALIRSLNIPAVHMLKTYRYEKFHTLLRNMGMNTLNRGPDHYGLSLILGGAEGSLWEISGIYASMARTLNNYRQRPGKNRYDKNDFHPPTYVNQIDSVAYSHQVDNVLESQSWLSASAIFQTFDALEELYRPGEQTGWRYFSSSKKIAWKTGTSFGFRDGWAIGVTPRHVVGVWVGNADGEGRPGLTGTDSAAPIMFDLFSLLNEDEWFNAPLREMESVTVCKKSGYRNSKWCDDIDTVKISNAGLQSEACPFHKPVHLSANLKFRVHTACESPGRMVRVNWFVLPPMQEYYFRQKNFSYKVLPAFLPGCKNSSEIVSMGLIYPKNDSEIFIPRELNGSNGKVIFELAHSDPAAVVYWHLDGNFIGTTTGKHNMPLNPPQGRHSLTIVDDNGESINHSFSVISYM